MMKVKELKERIRMTEDKVLSVIKSSGVFSVNKYKYEHQGLRKKLRKMARAGLIVSVKTRGPNIEYVKAKDDR